MHASPFAVRLRRLWPCWVAWLSPAVFAQPLPEVVVTATRIERPLAESLVDISIIDAQAIAASGAGSVPEVLRSLAGVEISQNGGPAGNSGLFVRGSRTAQTLVMIDGVRMENPASGGANLEFLPLSAVERIEVVRGPASALYGSAAIGGVVQIFTRSGSAPASSASMAAGSAGTVRWQAGFSRALGDPATRLDASVSGERSGGFDATLPGSPDHQSDRDGYRRRALSAGLSHQLASGWRLAANLLASDGGASYDDAYATPDKARLDFRSTAMGVSAQGRFSPEWQMVLRAGQTGIDYRYLAFDFAPRTRAQTLLWINSFSLPRGRLDLGLEQLRQRMTGAGVTEGDYPYQRSQRRTDSVFAAWELALAAHRVRLQYREDRIESVGSEPTAALGWGWQPAPGWQLRANWASSFRAPTFDDLYSPFGANPALRAERGRGVEFGLERRLPGGQRLQLVVFENRIRDAIELDADYVPRNLARARVRGASLESSGESAAWFWLARATVQDARGARDDEPLAASQRLARRARAFGTVSAGWRQGPIQASMLWTLQGDRVDTRGQGLPGYGLLDLNASWRLDARWELFGRIGNLTDRAYQTAYGYRMPARMLMVGLRFQER